MEAKEISFKSIMQDEKELKIPFFQRQYVWKKTHWNRFFNDLYESFNSEKEHFLGSIILKRSQGKDNFSKIIDGQQRLTTFSILIKAFYDEIDTSKKKYFDSCLFEDFNDNSPKIKHSKLDKEEYSKIFFQSDSDNNIENIKNGIIGCYNTFREKKKYFKSKDDIFEFIKFITTTKIFVAVCLNENEDEQKIFDSINSTGEPLNATVIIKNALFDKAIKEVGEERADELYKEYWEKVFENSEKERNFWNEKISVGRINRVRSEILLHAFAVMKNFFNPDIHRMENLSSVYKDKIKSFNAEELKDFLSKICNVAKEYYKLPRFNKKTLINYEWQIRFFHIIDKTNTNTVLPLILFLNDKLKDNKERLKKCFYMLEILILVNTKKKDYNKFFARLIRDISNNNNLDIVNYIKQEIYEKYNKYLEPKSIKNKLYKIENNDAKLILFWIELYLECKEQNFKDKTIGLQYVYTLEHLMPQKWKSHWQNIIDSNGKILTNEKANELIYQIGNMTLIKGGLNASIKNAEWNKKLNGDGKVKNYIRKNAELLINKELLDKKQWGEDNITNRTTEIIKTFYCIWDLEIFN